jgi:plastocyanin
MSSNRFWVFLLATLSLASLVAVSVNIPPKVSAAATPSISLVGFISAWNNTSVPNPTITVTQGDTLTIQLSSGDGAVHRFFVDVDKNGMTPDCPGADVCSNVFPPSTTLTFTVNFAPGTYTYYCSVHPTTMFGQFVVLQPPVTGGGGRHPLEM